MMTLTRPNIEVAIRLIAVMPGAGSVAVKKRIVMTLR